MNTFKYLKKWANNITETLVVLIILILLVEILLGQTNIPFIGSFDLTQQIIIKKIHFVKLKKQK